ncbi:hypothetical protein [Clostridium luticellarii]|uniref:Uncharacterized protein n=1 Tax=Clostridium luticellarii TaxID=1691940 RepID=A0A2T0BF11_9CLOT|nr:hypothetical protein [Clostridium luticellarii]PRR82496.1 hypothetical protein CLLU_28480 [Clostridium luticellarii]
MKLRIQYNCVDVDWNCVSEILKRVGMALFRSTEKMQAKGFIE